MDEKSQSVPWCANSVQLLGFSSTVQENALTLWSPFAIFEPYIWRRLGPFPACFNCGFLRFILKSSSIFFDEKRFQKQTNIPTKAII